jgi:penicillin G amidase
MKLRKIVVRAALVLLLQIAIVGAVAYVVLRQSLPQLTGEHTLAKLAAPVTVARDALGTATINATNDRDAMRALGFVHAQERFFEMDLTRRAAAGELAALFGKAALPIDKQKRVHRFRTRMAAVWADTGASEREILTAYADGVNAGLANLNAKPWQYTLLRTTPEAWREVDSLLVMCEMYVTLQSLGFERALANARLREKVGDELFQWLKPIGGEWDAAMDGSVMPPAPLPTAEKIDMRIARETPVNTASYAPAADVGSNAWAVAGALTSHGGGMLANDMHLNLSAPNIWFRAQFQIGGLRAAGVTLPGVPAMVVGSNGQVAWGFTNSYGRWFEWQVLPKETSFNMVRETIQVNGAAPEIIEIKETPSATVMETQGGKHVALTWLAHRPEALNANLIRMMRAKDVDDALSIAQSAGLPHQNILIVDRSGNLAWTIAGRMPRRAMVETRPIRPGFVPSDQIAADWLPPAEYPVIKNPPSSRLWTANNRQLGGTEGAKIDEGGFDLGARSQQIRERLFSPPREKFVEADLSKIHIDTEARFMKRWATKLASAGRQNADVVRLLASWNGRADADQVGYRLAREFRIRVLDELWKAWVTHVSGAAPDGPWDNRFEYPAGQAMHENALHLLPKPFTSWDEFLAAQANAVVAKLTAQHGSLDQATWGAYNLAVVRHPLSRAVPQLGWLLNMPATPMSGDAHMPKVEHRNFGASERLVVAPGHEETATLTMPGGQSGHPLSPFYGAGHRDWAEGKTAPLLAGPTMHTLTLSPER